MNGNRYTDEELLDVIKSGMTSTDREADPSRDQYIRQNRPANRPVKLAIAHDSYDANDQDMQVDNKIRTLNPRKNENPDRDFDQPSELWKRADRWAKKQGATHVLGTESMGDDGPRGVVQAAHNTQKLKSLIKSIDAIIERLS